MSRRRSWQVLCAAAGFSVLGLASPASAGCAAWGCPPACGAPAWFGVPPFPCAGFYPPQPVYRVEQGPIHNVVVIPYEAPRLHIDYLPPRFSADCGCYR
jgi:hypothetical protein